MLYKVKCLDAKFEETEGNLILNCWFEDLQAKKILVMPKVDFNFRGEPVPDHEMEKAAKLFKDKVFNIDFQDQELSEEEIAKYEEFFSKGIHEQIDEIDKELLDPKKQLERSIERVLAKEEDKKRFDKFNKKVWKE